MATPEQDIKVDRYALSGSRPRRGIAEQVARMAEGQAAGMENLFGKDFTGTDYKGITGEDPAKAMLKSSEAMLEEVKAQTRYLRDTVEMLRQSNEMGKRQADVIKQAVFEASSQTREMLQSGPTGAVAIAGRPASAAGGQGVISAPDGVVDPNDIARMKGESVQAPANMTKSDEDFAAQQRKAMADRLYAAQSKPVDTVRTEFFSGVARKISEYAPSADDIAYSQFQDAMVGDGPSGATLSLMKRKKLLESGRQMAGSVADKGLKGGMMSSLANSGLARVAGTGAMVVGVANAGFDFAEDQREENRAYQAATGDSNFGGFAFRTRQNLFGIAQKGRMGSENAQRLYGEVTKMNVDEATRAEALDFAGDAFMRFGQSVDQSVQMIQSAIDRGETNFASLTASLESVSDAAALANVNAEQARALFNNQLTSATQTIGQGEGTTRLAQTVAGYQTSMGATMMDANIDVLNPLTIQTLAAQRGLTRNQVVAGIRSGEMTRDALQLNDTQVATVASRALGDGAAQRIRARAEEAAGGMSLGELMSSDPTRYNTILREALTEEQRAGNVMDTRSLMNHLTALTGRTPASEEDALRMIGDAAVGTSMTGRYDAEQAEREQSYGTTAIERGDSITSTIRDRTNVANDVHLMGTGVTPGEFRDSLVDAYAQTVSAEAFAGQGNAQFSGVIDDIVGSAELNEQFVVSTKDGRRVVSAEEAIRNFSDQLQSGEAEFFGSSRAGQTVADAFGFEVGEFGDTGITGESGTKNEESELGMSIEEARQKQIDEAREGAGGRVIVEPGPGLVGPNGQPLFRFLDDIDIYNSNRAGIPASTRP